MTVLIAVLPLIAAAAAACRRTRRALHMWQMDSYIWPRYVAWLFAKPLERYVDLPSLGLGAAAAVLARFQPLAAAGLLAAWCAWLASRKDTEPSKKPLDMTARAKRTLWTARALIGMFAAAAALFEREQWLLAAMAALHMAPWSLLGADLLLKPVHARINRRFARQAAARLKQLDPLVIGVAGSYGKTSTKYFLDVLLSEKFTVLKSPGNYNTLLGITRVVNEMLKPEHRVLIAEMGAYKRGEVAGIAALVHPKIGIICSIGPEHFERFRSMENIERTNYELIEALPPDGLAVFNGSDPRCLEMAARTTRTRTALYGLADDGRASIWAEDLVHTREGLRFRIVLRDGRTAPAATAVMGRHMALNMLGAARIALELGLSLEQIVAGIARLAPAPHRLEVKPGAGGTTIIDDSYNSNPAGAAEALQVLSQFTGGKRILVTPGMIELGALHQEKNEEFGRLAAQSADLVFLVGPEQTRPVQDGLRKAGFPERNLRIVKDLAEVTAEFPKVLRPGDAILFENDLPDLYTER